MEPKNQFQVIVSSNADGSFHLVLTGVKRSVYEGKSFLSTHIWPGVICICQITASALQVQTVGTILESSRQLQPYMSVNEIRWIVQNKVASKTKVV